MLDRALHGGRAGRVYRSLVLEQQIAVDAEGGIHYPVGDLFDYNGPTLMVTRLLHKPEYSADQTIAAYDQVLDEMEEKGITSEELEPLKVKFRSNYFSMLEGGHGASIPRYGLMHLLACFTLFDNDPHLVNSILGGFMEVTPDAVQSAAHKMLTRPNRSIVIRQPAKKAAA
jgi:predicted Zn-dependent peptidase